MSMRLMGAVSISTVRWHRARSCGVPRGAKYAALASCFAWRRTAAFRVSPNSSRSAERSITLTTPLLGALSECHAS